MVLVERNARTEAVKFITTKIARFKQWWWQKLMCSSKMKPKL